MSSITLAERVLAIDAALADVPHAFGGALALAYYAEPRATIDIDCNVFVPATDFDVVAGALRSIGVGVDDVDTSALVARDGQVRVFWDATPVDLFFSYDAFHDAAAVARRTVPFADQTIEVLSREHLLVCKVVFDRPKDWVDIDAMLAEVDGDELDAAEVLRWVGRIAGDTDPRYERITALLTRR
jgi:hypothetical protein